VKNSSLTFSHPNRAEFLSGVINELPLLLGVSPFGMIYGALALQALLPVAAAQAMSSIIFAGSAQFISTQLLAQGIPLVILVGTVFIVNLRHMLYSASIAPYTRHLSMAWKAVLAYFLTDEAYVIAIAHYNEDTPLERKHWYFLGAGVTLWTGWQIATAAGIFLGAQVPAAWSLDFALALTFIALVVPALKDRPAVVAAIVAGVIALVAYPLPYKLGLIAAAFGGIISGLVSEGLWRKSG
jgi:predicted branched-subunit amino acid permease